MLHTLAPRQSEGGIFSFEVPLLPPTLCQIDKKKKKVRPYSFTVLQERRWILEPDFLDSIQSSGASYLCDMETHHQISQHLSFLIRKREVVVSLISENVKMSIKLSISNTGNSACHRVRHILTLVYSLVNWEETLLPVSRAECFGV